MRYFTRYFLSFVVGSALLSGGLMALALIASDSNPVVFAVLLPVLVVLAVLTNIVGYKLYDRRHPNLD